MVEFTEHDAMQLLTVFATKWEALPDAPSDTDFQYHLVVFDITETTEQIAVRFAGRTLRPDQIVVSHPAIVRRL